MKFTKMHGLGNDFVVVDDDVDVTPALVQAMCHRRFGAGADGLLQVSAPDGVVTMGYWNADGSTAEMCGNGLRCVARRAWDLGFASDRSFRVDTPIGSRRVVVGDELVSVDLGPVTLTGSVEIDGTRYVCVDVGNPHAVTDTDPDGIDVAAVGALVERHPYFTNGTNVEFFTWSGPDSVRMRVWERGVGETMACGTGMVAVAAVALEAGDHHRSISVEVPGGVARVELSDGTWLTGPAETVYEAVWISGPS